MTIQPPPKQSHDPKAKAVAEAVYEALCPIAVILFGSRARGNYHDGSDVDLLIIIPDDAPTDFYKTACSVVWEKAETIYGQGAVITDLSVMRKSEFADGRRAKNQVAAQAVRDGVVVSRQPLPSENQAQTNWPDIQEQFESATWSLNKLRSMIEEPISQVYLDISAQQAVEKALKAWISALDDEYGGIHDLSKLAAIIRRHPAENGTPAGEALFWLTEYAVEYRHDGAKLRMDDPHGLWERVTELMEGIAARIHQLTGRHPPRWAPPK